MMKKGFMQDVWTKREFKYKVHGFSLGDLTDSEYRQVEQSKPFQGSGRKLLFCIQAEKRHSHRVAKKKLERG